MLSICFLCVSVPKSKLLAVKLDEYGTLLITVPEAPPVISVSAFKVPSAA